MVEESTVQRQTGENTTATFCCIFAEFLSKDRAGGVMFSVDEHNEEEEWRKFREAEREYGIELGIEKGREEEREFLLHNLMENQGLSEEDARKALGIV